MKNKPSSKVLAAVESIYFVDNPLVSASEERNSTVDVSSGVLKTLKAESCSLNICKVHKEPH